MMLDVIAASALLRQTIPGQSYAANAVHFAGGIQDEGPTYLSCASLSATNNGYFSFSIWQKGLVDPLNAAPTASFFVVDPASAYFPLAYVDSYTVNPGFVLGFGDESYSNYQYSYWANLNYTNWNHYLGSADMNHAAGSRISILYINDVLVDRDTVDDIGIAFVNAVNGKRFVFGDDGSGNNGATMDVADVWIAPGVALHEVDTNGPFIPEATRRLFIDAGGKPANPSGFPASAILFTGNSASFATNQGTGGSFSLTGSLTPAATSP